MNEFEQNDLLTPLQKWENTGDISEREEKKEKGPQGWRKRTLQYAAVVSVSMVSMGFAASEIWTSPALPYLKSNNSSEFTITQNQASWVASIHNIGTLLGYLLYPLLVDRIGRKSTLLIFSIPQILSWAMIYLAKNIIILYLARIIGGMGYAGAFSVQVMYISEIADKNNRGFLIFMSRMFNGIGSLIVYIAAAFLSYHNMNLVILSFPILFFFTFIFMPESPYYHLKRNQEIEAFTSLRKFQGVENSDTIQFQIKRMKDAIIDEEKNKKIALKILFQDKRQRKAFVIVAIVLGCLIFSGIRVFSAFTQEILGFSNFSLAPQYSAIILTLVVILSSVPTSPLLDLLGRRIMILSSGIICALSLILAGLFFFLKYYLQITNISSLSWIPLGTLIVFEIACTAGIFPTSSVISGELFSNQVKSTALSLLYITKEIMTFLMKLSFEMLISTFGIYGVFWTYAVLCFSVSLAGFIIMPETKGKTLLEIQDLLD